MIQLTNEKLKQHLSESLSSESFKENLNKFMVDLCSKHDDPLTLGKGLTTHDQFQSLFSSLSDPAKWVRKTKSKLGDSGSDYIYSEDGCNDAKLTPTLWSGCDQVLTNAVASDQRQLFRCWSRMFEPSVNEVVDYTFKYQVITNADDSEIVAWFFIADM